MRITFITSKLNFETAGGSVADLDLKAKSLLGLGNTVSVITVFGESNKISSPLPYRLIEENIKKRRLMSIQISLFKILKKYEKQTDIYHLEGQFVYAAGFYKIFGGKVPVIAFFNRESVAWDLKANRILSRLKKKFRFLSEKYIGALIANRIDHFIFTNPLLLKAFADFGLDEKKSSVMPDFVDQRSTREIAGITEKEIINRPWDANRLKIFSSGRLFPEKGFEQIIKAVAKLPDKNGIEVILSGDGPDRNRLMKLAEEKGLGGIISFPGWVSKKELLKNLSRADAYILPKWRKELTSVLLIEAMTLGTPSIVPEESALTYLAKEAALSFSDEDSTDLSRKITALKNNPALRKKLSLACLKRAEEINHQKLAGELFGIITSETKSS